MLPKILEQHLFTGARLLELVLEERGMLPIRSIPFEMEDDHTMVVKAKDLVPKEKTCEGPCVLVIDWSMYTDAVWIN